MVILVGNYNFIIKNIFEMKDVVYIELMILLMKFFFLEIKFIYLD